MSKRLLSTYNVGFTCVTHTCSGRVGEFGAVVCGRRDDYIEASRSRCGSRVKHQIFQHLWGLESGRLESGRDDYIELPLGSRCGSRVKHQIFQHLWGLESGRRLHRVASRYGSARRHLLLAARKASNISTFMGFSPGGGDDSPAPPGGVESALLFTYRHFA